MQKPGIEGEHIVRPLQHGLHRFGARCGWGQRLRLRIEPRQLDPTENRRKVDAVDELWVLHRRSHAIEQVNALDICTKNVECPPTQQLPLN